MSRKLLAAVAVAGLWAGTAHADFGPGFRVFPNPVRADQGQSQILFEDVLGGGDLKIFTASGRLVLEKSIDPAATSFSWDLKNGEGRNVAAGMYIYFLSTGGNSRSGKIGIIR